MELYLIRHGTTVWNAERRIQGRTDIPLDEYGTGLARITGKALREQGIFFDECFSSPLIRALHTAELTAGGTPVRVDPLLTELCFGSFEGRSVPEMQADETCPFRFFRTDPLRYDREMQKLMKSAPELHFESLTSLIRRADRFLLERIVPLVRLYPDDARILVAGHGAMNRALIMAATGNRDLRTFWGTGLSANCGIVIVDAKSGKAGEISFRTDDRCRVYYGEDALHGTPSLL